MSFDVRIGGITPNPLARYPYYDSESVREDGAEHGGLLRKGGGMAVAESRRDSVQWKRKTGRTTHTRVDLCNEEFTSAQAEQLLLK